MNKKRTKCNSSPLNSSTPQAIKLKKTSTSIMKSQIERQESISVNAGILIKQIENYFDNDNISVINLFPSVCGSYDSLVCQMISQYGINNGDTLHQFNDPLISINWRLLTAKSSGKTISDDNEFLEEFIEFYEKNFTTKKEITNILLSQLLLWLSWLDNPTDFFNKKNWLNGIVDKLLKILKSKPKDPKSLSTAVACLAYLIVGHPAANSVLTDNNVNQLLKLCLNRSVHPDNNEIGLLEWDVITSRLGLRKLLEIPKVRNGKTTNTEIISFVLKWWTRLVEAANNYPPINSTNHHQVSDTATNTQQSAINNSSTIYEVPGGRSSGGDSKPGVPCLRAALEVISDIFERVETVRDALLNVIVSDGGAGLAFLAVYLSSEDYNTAVSASSLLLQILHHLKQLHPKHHIRSEQLVKTATTTTTTTGSMEDVSLSLQLDDIVDKVLRRLNHFNNILNNIQPEPEPVSLCTEKNHSRSSHMNRRQTRQHPKPPADPPTLPAEQDGTTGGAGGRGGTATYIVAVPVMDALVGVLQAINIYYFESTVTNNNGLKPINGLPVDSATVNLLGGSLEILLKNLATLPNRENDPSLLLRPRNCETISYLLVLIYSISEKNNITTSSYNDSEEKENNSNYSNTMSPTVGESDRLTCKQMPTDVIAQILRNIVQLFPSTYQLLTSTLEYMEIQLQEHSNFSDTQLQLQLPLEAAFRNNLLNCKELLSAVSYYKTAIVNLVERSEIANATEVASPSAVDHNIIPAAPKSPLIESVTDEDDNASHTPELPSLTSRCHSRTDQYQDVGTGNNKDDATSSSVPAGPPFASHFVTQLPDQPLFSDTMVVDTTVPPGDANSTTTITNAVVTTGQTFEKHNDDNLEGVSCDESPEHSRSIDMMQQLVEDETVDDIECRDMMQEEGNGTAAVSVSPICKKVVDRVSTPVLAQEAAAASRDQLNALRPPGSADSEETVTPDSRRLIETPMSVEGEDNDEVDGGVSRDSCEYSPRRSYPCGGPFSDNTVWRKAREEKFGKESEYDYDAEGSDLPLQLLDRRLDFDAHDQDPMMVQMELQSKTHELQQYRFQFLDDEVTGLLRSELPPAHRLLLVRLRDYHSAAVTDAKKWKVKYERLYTDHECLRGEHKVATTASCNSERKALTLAAQVEDLKAKCNQLSEQLQQTCDELVRERERKRDADSRARKQEELLQEAWLKLQAVSRAEAASRLQVTEEKSRAAALTEKTQKLSAERNEVELLLAEANVSLLQTQTNFLNLQSKEEVNSSKLRRAKELIQELHYEKLSLIDRIESIDSSHTRETKHLEEALQKGIEKDNIIYQCREEIKVNQATIEKLKLELIDLNRVFEEEKTTNRALNTALEREKSIRREVEVKLQASQEHVANLQIQLAEKVATIATLSTELQQKCVQVEELSVALEQQQQRGDALDIEISKHKELICFINKISAETEARKNLE